jgi:hypothetical protein
VGHPHPLHRSLGLTLETRFTRSLKSANVGFVELIQSVQRFEGELQHIYQSLPESDQYSSSMFAQSSEPVRLLIMHHSWHQAYCDLYRLSLAGYREAAPSSILKMIHRDKIMEWQSLCLQHAITIFHLLADFAEQHDPKVVDFDTAVCAYHSSRLVLFIAATNTFPQMLTQAEALRMARFCHSFLTRVFAGSVVADSTVSGVQVFMLWDVC